MIVYIYLNYFYQYLLAQQLNNRVLKNGYIRTHWKIYSPYCSAEAFAKNNGQQKCHRVVIYDSVNIFGSLHHSLYQFIFRMEHYLHLLLKIIFISLTAYTIYLIKFKKPYKLSLDCESDYFSHYYLYGIALMTAVVAHVSLNPIQFIWSFSIWLQSLAIILQLYMINKLKDIENITAHQILLLGLYRALYILFHWQFIAWTSFSAGIIKTLLYVDFIYYFIKANQQERIISFPV